MLGSGILKGMAVTAENFAKSYVDKEHLTTVEYPEAGSTITAFSRNLPFLVYDGSDPIGEMRCVSCKICEKECPPQCIFIVQEKDANGKLVKRPQVFDIDASVCMSCQICVEVCPFEAIKMDIEFELSTSDRFGALLLKREQLLKSNEYYHKIHPAEAQEVDDRLEADRKKKAAADAAKTATAAAAKLAAEKTSSPAPQTPPASTPPPATT
jgi:NADH-quinone oxidoreductase subunit I